MDGAKLTFKIFEHGMGSTPLEAKNDARTKAVKIARDNCQVTTSPACAPGCLDAGEVVRYKTYPFVVVFSPDPPEQTGTNPDMFRTFASIGKDAGFLNQSQENYCYTRRNCEKGCSAKEADFNVTGRKVINSRTQGIANSQAKADLAAEGARTALLANCNGTSLACNTAPNNNKCKDGTPTGRLFKWETTSNGQRQRTFITDLDSIEPASVSVGQITGGWQTIAVMGDAGGGLKAIYCHAEKPCNLP
ncbi:MAG: hypothetical protein Q7R81_06745 [Candidatus Peregrinibacteria bacterium]|nr:hypothetical protein [Candidatus Peregrinibacteria bacterium]